MSVGHRQTKGVRSAEQVAQHAGYLIIDRLTVAGVEQLAFHGKRLIDAGLLPSEAVVDCIIDVQGWEDGVDVALAPSAVTADPIAPRLSLLYLDNATEKLGADFDALADDALKLQSIEALRGENKARLRIVVPEYDPEAEPTPEPGLDFTGGIAEFSGR